MNTQYRKNLKAVLEASKNYTDNKIEDLKWELGTYDLSVDSVDGTTMLLPTPSGALQMNINKVEGNSEDAENYIKERANSDYNGITLTKDTDGGYILNGTATATIRFYFQLSKTVKGGFTYSYNQFNKDSGYGIYLSPEESSSNSTNIVSANSTTPSTTITPNADYNYMFIYIASGTQLTNTKLYPMLVEGSSVPTTYRPNFEGIHNFAWNGIKVEGSNLANITEINYRLATNGTLIQSENGNTSDYIKVKEGETYSTNIVAYTTTNYLSIAYYDSNKTFVSGVLANQNVSNITIPSGVSYMRVSYRPSLVENLMVNRGSTVLDYVPYIAPTTTTIDLSTITYNDSPLFEENSLKGVGTAKDYITPYLAHKGMGYIDLGSLDYSINNYNFPSVFVSNDLASLIKVNMPNVKANILCANYTVETRNDMVQGQIDKTISLGAYNVAGTSLYICDGTYSGNPTALKTALNGVYLVYELATPIEVSIDWTDKLVRQTCYSNGSTTLLNTNNQDTTSQIDYLKEVAK